VPHSPFIKISTRPELKLETETVPRASLTEPEPGTEMARIKTATIKQHSAITKLYNSNNKFTVKEEGLF